MVLGMVFPLGTFLWYFFMVLWYGTVCVCACACVRACVCECTWVQTCTWPSNKPTSHSQCLLASYQQAVVIGYRLLKLIKKIWIIKIANETEWIRCKAADWWHFSRRAIQPPVRLFPAAVSGGSTACMLHTWMKVKWLDLTALPERRFLNSPPRGVRI